MKSKLIFAALALTVTAAATTRLAAQPAPAWQSDSWDREAFWRGAPDDTQQRIDWLERRIDRGISDGTLDPTEARRARYELENLRRDAATLDSRLDNLSRNLRWSRRGSGYGYGSDGRDPYATDYDASRYYRDDPRYQERRLGANDEVYRGSDGRYYCKRSDGTTGLIVGAAGGALLGRAVDTHGERATGTILGAAAGALIGRSVERSRVRCR